MHLVNKCAFLFLQSFFFSHLFNKWRLTETNRISVINAKIAVPCPKARKGRRRQGSLGSLPGKDLPAYCTVGEKSLRQA